MPLPPEAACAYVHETSEPGVLCDVMDSPGSPGTADIAMLKGFLAGKRGRLGKDKVKVTFAVNECKAITLHNLHLINTI